MQAQHEAQAVVDAIEARLALIKSAAVALAQCKVEEVPRLYAEIGQHIEGLQQEKALPEPLRQQAEAQTALHDPIDVWASMSELQSELYGTQQRILRMKGAMQQYLLDCNFDRVLPAQWQQWNQTIDQLPDSSRLTEFFNANYRHWYKTWCAIVDGIVTDEATYFQWRAIGCPVNWAKDWRWFDRVTEHKIKVLRTNPLEDREYDGYALH